MKNFCYNFINEPLQILQSSGCVQNYHNLSVDIAWNCLALLGITWHGLASMALFGIVWNSLLAIACLAKVKIQLLFYMVHLKYDKYRIFIEYKEYNIVLYFFLYIVVPRKS